MLTNLTSLILAVVVAVTMVGPVSSTLAASRNLTTGSDKSSQTTVQVKPATRNGLVAPQGQQAGPGGAKIDLSVCDLATFDHDKCLGGK